MAEREGRRLKAFFIRKRGKVAFIRARVNAGNRLSPSRSRPLSRAMRQAFVCEQRWYHGAAPSFGMEAAFVV